MPGSLIGASVKCGGLPSDREIPLNRAGWLSFSRVRGPGRIAAKKHSSPIGRLNIGCIMMDNLAVSVTMAAKVD